MTTAVPTYLTLPLLALMAIIVVVRYRFFNSNQYEAYFNHTLVIMLAANLLREHAINRALDQAGILTVTQSEQLSLAILIFAAAEIVGLVMVWSKVPTAEVLRRQRRMRLLAAVLATGFLIAGSPARNAGLPLEIYGGWVGVLAWVFNTTMFLIMAARLTQMSAREFRSSHAQGREKTMAAGMFVIGVAVGITSMEAIVASTISELGWADTAQLSLAVHATCVFWESVATSLLGAVPAVLAVAAHFGYDATSRQWRQLEPLRISMITAVPSCAFELRLNNTGRRKILLELHQSTIQIRDAILQLRAYSGDIDDATGRSFLDTYAVSPDEREPALQALQLARAVTAKVEGAEPRVLDRNEVLETSESLTLEQDTTELVRLAKWWPQAQEAARLSSR